MAKKIHSNAVGKTQIDFSNKQLSEFFTKLKFVQNIVVLGYSLAVVDYLYFEEIAKTNNNQAMWYIGYYSLEDLRRLIALVNK